MSLWVPPRVSRELQESTEEFKAEVLGMVQRFEGTMRYWTERYQHELDDDRLEIIFAPPTADPEVVTPGRYHLIRRNEPPTPPTVEPIEDPVTGGFIEPGAWHIEQMRQRDLQNPQIARMYREAREAEARAKERAKAREAEERVEEIGDRLRAATQTSISFNRDTPWTQNAAGRRKDGRRKAN